MKNNKRSYPHLFFYINSIFVFTIVAISSFFKVFLLIYKEEMAMASKLGEEIDVLPLTGSPTLSVDLSLLIIIIAILSAFIFIMKLTKFDSTKLFRQIKDKKKIRKYKTPKILKVSIISTIIIVVLSIFLKFIHSDLSLYIKNENSKLLSPIYLEDSDRYPGSIEEVIIKANPLTDHDSVALVRLSFDNATILEVTPLEELTLGTCIEGRLFTAHSICADVSKLEYFNIGDPLLKVKIQWGESGESNITADIGNGYYDGVNINNKDLNLAVDINGILPLTGEETTDNSIPVFILLVLGLVIILLILIAVTKTHPVFNRIPVYYSIFLIIGLGVSTIYIANRIKDTEQVPVGTKAYDIYNNDTCLNTFDYDISPDPSIESYNTNIAGDSVVEGDNYWYVFSPKENGSVINWEENLVEFSNNGLSLYYKATITNGTFQQPMFDVRTFGDSDTASNHESDPTDYVPIPTDLYQIDGNELVITLFSVSSGDLQEMFSVNRNFLIKFIPNGVGELYIRGRLVVKDGEGNTYETSYPRVDLVDNLLRDSSCQNLGVYVTESEAPIGTGEESSTVGGLLTSVPLTIDDGDELEIEFVIDMTHSWIHDKITEACGAGVTFEECNLLKAILFDASNVDVIEVKCWDSTGFIFHRTVYPDYLTITDPVNKVMFFYGADICGSPYKVKIRAIKPSDGTPLEISTKLLIGNSTDLAAAFDDAEIDRIDIFPSFSIPFSFSGASVDVNRCAEIPDSLWGEAGKYCSPISGESKILLDCDANQIETGFVTCQQDCVVAAVGQNDYCREDAPTTNPTTPPQPTTTPISQTTITPAAQTTIIPTNSAVSNGLQCGQTGCTKDSDCATGLPEYECDESSTNWPDNNKCIKVCPSGETRTDDCTCSGSGGLYQCGPIDIDGNGLINYIDLANFRKVYNKTCSDSPYQGGGCKGADTNNDGRINYKDLSSFASRYYPKALTCNL